MYHFSLLSANICSSCFSFFSFGECLYVYVYIPPIYYKSSDIHICNLLYKKAEIGVKIFSQYGIQIHNVNDLEKIHREYFSSVMIRN